MDAEQCWEAAGMSSSHRGRLECKLLRMWLGTTVPDFVSAELSGVQQVTSAVGLATHFGMEGGI